AAGQHLMLEGTLNNHAIVKASVSSSSGGHTRLTWVGGADVLAFELGANTLTNNGTITAEAGTGGSRSIEGNLTNNGTVTLAGETNSLTGNLTNKGKIGSDHV